MKKHNLLKNDRGSTIITVLVAVAFIVILSAIILSTSITNYRMKGIDRKTKDDFYNAEKALKDIYTGMGQDITKIAATEYEKAFGKMGTTETDMTGTTTHYGTSEIADREYRKRFLEELRLNYLTDNSASALTTSTKLHSSKTVQDVMEDYVVAGAASTSTVTVEWSETDSTGASNIIAEDVDGVTHVAPDEDLNTCTRIKDIRVTVVDDSGYQSTVCTDIVVKTPSVNFFGENVELDDYALVGNTGIDINGTANVSGSMFGGTTAKDSLVGGITIAEGKSVQLNGEYIVSRGDITVGNGATLTIGDETSGKYTPNVWFESMLTRPLASGLGSATTIKVDGTGTQRANFYALNDLELDSPQSNVTLTGNYYGYNEGTLPAIVSTEHQVLGGLKHTDNSAIIINGNKSTLNLEKLDNFVLMGRAYIDFTSKGSVSVVAGDDEIATGEGLALKSNQQLYLVPSEFLTDTNPCSGSAPSGWIDITPTNWFGYKYVKDPTTGDLGMTAETLNKGGADYTYAFLKFNDSVWIKSGGVYYEQPAGTPIGTGGAVSSQHAYLDEILTASTSASGIEPTAYTLRKRVQRTMTKGRTAGTADFFNLQSVVVGTASSQLFSKNIVVTYQPTVYGESGQTIATNTVGMDKYAGYEQNLWRRFRRLCCYLDGQEDVPISGVGPSGVGSPVSDITNPTDWDNAVAQKLPVSNFVDTSLFPASLADSNTHMDATYGRTIIGVGNYTVNSNFSGVIIVDGDVTVATGTNVDGMIMATGKITLAGNNVITANQALIQKRIEKEIALVRDGGSYEPYYLITYLTDTAGNRMYDVAPKEYDKKENRVEFDYNKFMYYENWQKGDDR